MLNLITCPVCGTSHMQVNILSCTKCKHIFRNYPLINLEDYYTNHYRSDFTQEIEIRSNAVMRSRNEFRLSAIEPFLNSVKEILEVGFGYGDFYQVLKEKHPSKTYSCCELDANLASRAKQNGIDTFNCAFQDMPTKMYDAVVSFDVLEHFYNPHDYLNKLLSLLKKDGIAVIQVPTDRRIHFEQPFDGHYHYFSKESLYYLMGQNFENLMFYKTKRGESANGREFLTVWKLK